MKKYLFYFLIISFFTEKGVLSYDGFEHVWMGDSVTLKFPENQQHFDDYPYKKFIDPMKKIFNIDAINPQYLELENGSALSFGEVLAFAGDHFTTLYTQIANAKGEKEENEYFLLAFSTLLSNRKSVTKGHTRVEYRDILDYLFHQGKYTPEIEDYIRKKSNHLDLNNMSDNPFAPEKYIPQLRTFLSHEFENILQIAHQHELDTAKIHGGKSRSGQKHTPVLIKDFDDWKVVDDFHTAFIRTKTLYTVASGAFFAPSYEFTTLLEGNFDHFGKAAIKAYKIGHRIALEKARSASHLRDVHMLNLAYAYEAFSLHFLTDQFASGHIRTPRKELYEDAFFSKTAGLAANAMHDEENYHGLNVTNKKGLKWKAYGDFAYFSPRNSINRQQIKNAIQASVDEIWKAFNKGVIPAYYSALDEVPIVSEKNYSPLFKVVGNEVWNRNSYYDLFDEEYVKHGTFTTINSWYVSQQDKVNLYDFRSVIHTNKNKNLKISYVNCECMVEGTEMTHSDFFEVGIYEIDLEGIGFKGYKKELKNTIKKGRTYPVLIQNDLEKVLRSCKILKAKTKTSNPVHLYIHGPNDNSHVEVLTVDGHGYIGKLNELLFEI